MTVLEGTAGFSSEDFKLKFAHVPDVLYDGGRYTATYEATGSFKVGDNLSGTCGGSGVCSWSLNAGHNPVLITPAKVA